MRRFVIALATIRTSGRSSQHGRRFALRGFQKVQQNLAETSKVTKSTVVALDDQYLSDQPVKHLLDRTLQ
jgi:hypothetical protein